MSVKIDIISGFLGAGKTTLIKKLLEDKPSSEKTVIIENEFGSVGIDGKLLKKTGVSVREISSGCICCTLAGDFQAALNDVIKKYKPDRVMIEPSGVGKLSDILDSCRSILLRRNGEFGICMAVVDVTRYSMYERNFPAFFLDQIESAKSVILSRTQNASAEKLEHTVERIQKHNPDAVIITTPWEQLSAATILSAAEKRIPELIKKEDLPAAHPHHEGCCHDPHEHHGHDDHEHGHCHPHADESFEVWSKKTPKTFQAREIDTALQKIARYGTVLRAKGIVPVENGKWVQFDYVPGEASRKETSSDYTGRLCVIGRDLDLEGLASLFDVS